MSYNQTDFSLEHYCNGQKFHLGSEGSCYLHKPACLSRNLLEEERIKNGSLLKKSKSKNDKKEKTYWALMGTETPKNIELTYDSIKFINYPVKEKIELMYSCKPCKILLHTFETYSFCFLFPSLIGPFTEP